ncbi:hypothetical protein [Ensifer sp. LC163]|uniref:hypothetical protein n=1 Tax=Ensifer sp. LC163 TaxID=1120652 RepID=UPI001111C2FB|nr:hypothetical protein [Ensifer sp. LC163]
MPTLLPFHKLDRAAFNRVEFRPELTEDLSARFLRAALEAASRYPSSMCPDWSIARYPNLGIAIHHHWSAADGRELNPSDKAGSNTKLKATIKECRKSSTEDNGKNYSL